MLRHLLKLIWRRKGRNLMLSLEILLAFIVVFAVAAFAVRSTQLYNLPTGYVHDDVWAIEIRPPARQEGAFAAEVYPAFANGLKRVPQVEQVAFASTTPYLFRTYSGDVRVPGNAHGVSAEFLSVDDQALPLLQVTTVAGRLFQRSDVGSGVRAVILNRRMAEALFGKADPLGQQIDASNAKDKNRDLMRVVGIVDDYRSKGQLDAPHNVAIVLYDPAMKGEPMEQILVKMAPGTARDVEEALSRQLKQINNQWTYQIAPLSARRLDILREQLAPLVVLAIIGGFLLLMVAFGLFGVLWQNTTRRIPEIGLRRAIGASAGNIYRQIIAEQMLLSTAAMLVGLLLLVQLPLTGAMGDSLGWPVFLAATALSMAVIYLLSLLCSLYPGWRASRLSPTEALHYE